MGFRARQQAFFVAALLVVGVAVLLVALGPSNRLAPSRSEVEPPGGRQPLVLGGPPDGSNGPRPGGDASLASKSRPPSTEHEHEHDHEQPVPLSADVERAATAFLAAYFELETGNASASVRRSIRAEATPALARYLLGEPPRGGVATGPGRLARVVRLQSLPVPRDPRRSALAAVIDRGGAVTSLTLRLEIESGEWRVTELG